MEQVILPGGVELIIDDARRTARVALNGIVAEVRRADAVSVAATGTYVDVIRPPRSADQPDGGGPLRLAGVGELDDAAQGFRRMLDGDLFGKIVFRH